MTAPERLLRALAVTGAVAACAGGAALHPGALAWQRPTPLAALLLLGALLCARGEARPELQDEEPALRARRAVPAAYGLLGVGLFLFPWVLRGAFVWAAAWAATLLLPFAAGAHVRAACLLFASVGALGATVLDERAAPALLAVGAAWLTVPALGRVQRVRLQLPGERAPLGPALGGALVVLALAASGGWACARVLPPSRPLPALADRPAPPSPPAAPVELPLLELLVLLLLLGGLVLVVVLAAAPPRGEGPALDSDDPPPLPLSAPAPAGAEELEAALARWPASPRRRLVELYLRHLERLRALGHPRPPGVTPRAAAAALAAHVPAAAGAAARRLAERFARARWSGAALDPAEVAAAADEAREVEDQALLPARQQQPPGVRYDAGHGSGSA